MDNNFEQFLKDQKIKRQGEQFVWYGLPLTEEFVMDRFTEKKMRTIYVCSAYGNRD